MRTRLFLIAMVAFLACDKVHGIGELDPGTDGGLGGAAGGSTGGGGVTDTGGQAGSDVSGGVIAAGAGGTTDSGGVTVSGGATASGGATVSGGATAFGGVTSAGGSSAGSGGALPGDILSQSPNKCVSAHSTVRVIVTGYTGPLYQICLGNVSAGPSSCKGANQDIMSKDGYADAATQDTLCAGGCFITKIYDQSGHGNDLKPSPRGGAKPTPDNPANAGDLPVAVNGHPAYGILIKAGIGYRTGCSGCNTKTGNGMAKGDEPQTIYMVTSQKDLVDGCCFDYGNAETDSSDDGNGAIEAVYFGAGVVWGTGYGGQPGPWVMADLENGLYAGWENGQDHNISTNKSLKFDFVTAIVLGDTQDKNNGKGRFALYGADATSGTLATLYDGIRPEKPGYVPMQKQGSLILGTTGDNSDAAGGRFYEGVVATGPVASKTTLDALQAAIVAAKYGQ